jgi:nucleoside phosphorylase
MPLTTGRIGHARVAVLSAIKEETDAVRTVFNLTYRVPATPYLIASNDEPARPAVVNCETGRTNLQSGEGVRNVIELWQPEVILLCGTAGGIDASGDISIGDVVVPEYVHYCAFAKLSKQGQQRRFIAYDHPAILLHRNYVAPLRDDDSWITPDLRRSLVDGRTPKVHTVGIVAGDKVYGDPDSEEQALILKEFQDVAAAIDMESVGLCRTVAAARTNSQYNPRLLIVRGISDLISTRDNDEVRQRNKRLAANVAAVFAHRVVGDILGAEPDPRTPLGGSHVNRAN